MGESAEDKLDFDLPEETGDSGGGQASASGGSSGSSLIRRRGLSQVDFGKPDTMRHTILSLVISGSFESAIKELETYIGLQSDYPLFSSRVNRYVSHCNDLINAVRTKKNIPGLNLMSVTKQQELFDRVVSHMVELSNILKRIEHMEREIKLQDARSTIWVVRSVAAVTSVLVVVILIMDATNGMAELSWKYFDDQITLLTDALFTLMGF